MSPNWFDNLPTHLRHILSNRNILRKPKRIPHNRNLIPFHKNHHRLRHLHEQLVVQAEPVERDEEVSRVVVCGEFDGADPVVPVKEDELWAKRAENA